MGEYIGLKCDAFGTVRNVKWYRVRVCEDGAIEKENGQEVMKVSDSEIPFEKRPVVIEHRVALASRGLDRVDRFICRGVNPPGKKADDGQVTVEPKE